MTVTYKYRTIDSLEYITYNSVDINSGAAIPLMQTRKTVVQETKFGETVNVDYWVKWPVDGEYSLEDGPYAGSVVYYSSNCIGLMCNKEDYIALFGSEPPADAPEL